ncbi:MAG: phenylacetate--CoA ligase family protein [Candidatus Omnitrophica bacterium]|nr:phenylacetate--CoA ligase family protein [Candidatus Omnitrophota bacterium]
MMGLDFKIKDFAYPGAILKLKREFERHQWLSQEILQEYQLKRLQIIIAHAYQNVPYYQTLFHKNGLVPGDIKTIKDLEKIPCLTKDLLRINYSSLIARNVKQYDPMELATSGTTGGQVKFLVDRVSNVLEFVYYWRSWGWAGYRLGDKFAELSAQVFTPYETRGKEFYRYQPLIRRLLLNSLQIAHRNADVYVNIFRKFKPLFLKGLPSNLYMLALVLNERKGHGICLRAVFSQGETLLRHQRELIERVFSCKVFDAYGHMERTVAISQCSEGNYHVHQDYGVTEFEPFSTNSGTGADEVLTEIVSTSLYNFSMPLIRYRTGDLAKIHLKPVACLCKRSFPIVASLEGRIADVVITPDQRAITALYVALDRTPGILLGQIVQDQIDQLVVRVACDAGDRLVVDLALIRNIKEFVGNKMKIEIIHESVEKIRGENFRKFKSVVSQVSSEKIFGSSIIIW